MKKAIKVICNNMTDAQALQAMYYGLKHERTFSKTQEHTWPGSLGNYNVRCLKSITVRLA